jgi:hypothetical protein
MIGLETEADIPDRGDISKISAGGQTELSRVSKALAGTEIRLNAKLL